MKTTMTERDKKLLVGMFLFVIIVAISYWGILPQYKRYKKLEAKIETEEEEKKINQLKIANLGMIEIQGDEYEQKISEKKDEFYQVMKSSEIDRMMTEMASNRGLDIYELSFNMPTAPTGRLAYQYSDLYARQQEMIKEYEADDDDDDTTVTVTKDDDDDDKDDKKSKKKGPTKADVMNEMMGAEEGGYQPNTDIYAVPVTMTVGGDLEDLHSFVNDIIGLDKRVLMVGYSWGEFRDVIRRDANGNIIRNVSGSSDDGDFISEVNNAANGVSNGEATGSSDGNEADVEGGTVEVVVRKSLTVKLEIYMCDTSDIASGTDAAEEVSE